ncbi:hypothetical protein BC6_00045 [Bacillus phage BC-6]|nr:hypothetical protein BC6_00045 [Bacillus phage BC-6]
MGTQRQIDMTFDISYPSDQSKFLQRLGEKNPTDIVVQVFNKGVPYNLSGVTLGFEMRNDKEKILIDKDQSRFTLVVPLEGVFSYRPPLQVQSFYGNSYLAYFTFESGANRVTTERFRFYNDEDVQLAVAPELQEHYVSVIDDLVASNKTAMDEAKAIRDLINANGVVKKVGDTMTGDLTFQTGGASKAINWSNGATQLGRMVMHPSGLVEWFGKDNGGVERSAWNYSPNTNLFNIVANTNVVKKTGDTMTGNLLFDIASTSKRIEYTDGATKLAGLYSSPTRFLFQDLKNNTAPWEYDYTAQSFNVNGVTNLVKKVGDTMTGDLTFDTSGTLKRISAWDGTKRVAALAMAKSGAIWLEDGIRGNLNIWAYDSASQTFNIDPTVNTNLMKKTDYSGKDGRVNLSLTADATNIDSGFGAIADRRGNTVTVRLAIMRNAGATGEIVTNLPANMRPTLTLVKWGIAEDGSPLKYQIHTDGSIRFYTTGKGLRIVETFVTD